MTHRYIVLEIGCIECNHGFGDSEPSVRLATNVLAEAEASYRSRQHGSSHDVQILDLHTMRFGRADHPSEPIEWRSSLTTD